jgi:hypothetical protein
MKDEATVVRPRAGGNFLFGRTAIRPGPQDLDKQKGSSPPTGPLSCLQDSQPVDVPVIILSPS